MIRVRRSLRHLLANSANSAPLGWRYPANIDNCGGDLEKPWSKACLRHDMNSVETGELVSFEIVRTESDVALTIDVPQDFCADAAAEAARVFLARLQAKRGTLRAALPMTPEKKNSIAFVEQPKYSRVRFNLDAIENHQITPYSEVYGLHPREFVFGKNFYMLPSGDTFGFVSVCDSFREEDNDSDDSDDDWGWVESDEYNGDLNCMIACDKGADACPGNSQAR